MSEESREKRIFLEATMIEDHADRLAFLRSECRSDSGLFRRVCALIEADRSASELDGAVDAMLARALPPAVGDDARGDPAEGGAPIGRKVGSYEIVRELGAGGMGVVYEARQESPRRCVALKVLSGAPGLEVVRRFRNEAEILGRLEHPNIARIYEAGFDDSGIDRRPYFAMELVEGARPFDVFVRDERIGVDSCVALMVKVCEAVHFGHQRGVIHRDLKPSNILVGSNGEPKVIDFGVAGIAAGAELTLLSMATTPGQLVGTLRYMSPERFAATDGAGGTDARSDVYALGIVLFEAITGRSPFRLEGASPFDVPRIIRETDPARSTFHGTALRGDLRTIVLRAIAKDPARRYQTMDALAADLRSYLAGEPIEARRDHALYLLRRSVVRYRAGLSVAAAFLVLAGVAAVVYANLFHRAEQARTETAQALADLAVSNYGSLVALAQSAFDTFSTKEMLAALDACPEPLRGWEWRHLKSRADDSVATLAAAPAGPHQCVALARHGLVAIAAEGGLYVCDAETGAPVRTLLAPGSPLGRFGVSRDEGLIAVGGHARTAWIVDVDTGTVEHEIRDLPHWVTACAFSPDGGTMFLASGGEVWAYDLARRLMRAKVQAHDCWACTLAVSPDGEFVATAPMRRERAVRLWDATTLSPVAELRSDNSDAQVTCIGFAPDGERLFVGAEDGCVERWSVGRQALDHVEYHRRGVRWVDVTPDGEVLAVAVGDAIELRRTADMAPLPPLRGHVSMILSISSSPGAAGLLSADGTSVRRWDLVRRGGVRELIRNGHTLTDFALAPAGDRVATIDVERTLGIWDVRTGESIARTPAAHGERVRAMSFSPDGSMVATAGDDGFVRVWRSGDAGLVRAIDCGRVWLNNVVWTSDAERLVVTQDPFVLRVHSARDGSPLGSLAFSDAGPGRMSIAPDGRHVAVADQSGLARVIDVEGPTVVREIRIADPNRMAAPNAAFSPDGTLLATGDARGEVRLWAWRSGELVRSLAGHDTPAWVGFSPDGSLLVTCAGDGSALTWSVSTGRPSARLTGWSAVRGARFAPEGEAVVAICDDSTIGLWTDDPP